MLIRAFIFYLLLWVFVMIIGGTQQASGLLPLVSFPQLAPAASALLMLFFFRKDYFKLNFSLNKVRDRMLLLAAGFPLAVGILSMLAGLLFVRSYSLPVPELAVLLPVLVWMPLGALGEETGWRGYFHKLLKTKLSGLVSSIITGITWTLFHVHFFANGLLFMFFAILMFVSISIILFYIMQQTDFSVILAAIFHLGINLTSYFFFMDVVNQLWFIQVSCLFWVILAVIVVLRNRKVYFRK